jgi:hypothetical protein
MWAGPDSNEVAAMTLHFSTATVEERWQLGYWRDVVCDTFVRYGFEAPQRGRAGFRGEVTAQSLGGVQVATVISESHVVFRSPTEIRASSEDDYLVNLAVRGRVRVSQDGRDADLRSGDLAVYDSARPCRIACPGQFELVALKVPRQVFHAHSRLPRDVTATALRRPGGGGASLATPAFRGGPCTRAVARRGLAGRDHHAGAAVHGIVGADRC